MVNLKVNYRWVLPLSLLLIVSGCANVDVSPVRSMISDAKSGDAGRCIEATHKAAVNIENAEELLGDRESATQSRYDKAAAAAQAAAEHRRVAEEACYRRVNALESDLATHMEDFERFRSEIKRAGKMLQSITFEAGSAELSDQAQTVLDLVANKLMREPRKALAAGYTCNVGDEDYNLDLSQRRAENVVQYLVDKGVDADALAAQGFGSADPVASNDTPEGRQANRRVEIHYQE